MDLQIKFNMAVRVTFGPNTKPPTVARLAVGIPYSLDVLVAVDEQEYTMVKYCIQLCHDDNSLELFKTLHDFELLHQRMHLDCARVGAALPNFPGPVMCVLSSR